MLVSLGKWWKVDPHLSFLYKLTPLNFISTSYPFLISLLLTQQECDGCPSQTQVLNMVSLSVWGYWRGIGSVERTQSPQVGHLQRSPHTLNEFQELQELRALLPSRKHLCPLWPTRLELVTLASIANPSSVPPGKERRQRLDIYEDSRHKARTTIIWEDFAQQFWGENAQVGMCHPWKKPTHLKSS